MEREPIVQARGESLLVQDPTTRAFVRDIQYLFEKTFMLGLVISVFVVVFLPHDLLFQGEVGGDMRA